MCIWRKKCHGTKFNEKDAVFVLKFYDHLNTCIKYRLGGIKSRLDRKGSFI